MKWGRRSMRGEPAPDEFEQPVPVSAVGQITSSLLTKAWSGLLVTALALGPVGAALGGLAWVQMSAQPAAVQAASSTDRSGEQAMAGEFGQRVVVAWLTSTQDQPWALLALCKDASLAGLPAEAYQVRDVTVADIVWTGHLWSVTVAATVTDVRQTARRYFQVPVQVASGSVSVVMLPSPVAAPRVNLASTNYQVQLATSSPPGATVGQFLTAYLSGSGDLSRYLTPGVAMDPISPAPYTTVRLTDLRAATDIDVAKTPADGQQLRVLVIASAAVTQRQSSPVAYALTLRARAGRWEIFSIDQAPDGAISAATAAPIPASSVTPSPRPTSSIS